MGRLAYAAGGNDVATMSGGWNKIFKGYPVSPVQVMPKTDANSQIAALFGDFSMACKFGVVNNSLAFATSDQRYFDEDVTAIRVTERVAFVAHDLGNVNATAASQVPGPVIGLISAAS
jgi:HK97 family phage major capsid protein